MFDFFKNLFRNRQYQEISHKEPDVHENHSDLIYGTDYIRYFVYTDSDTIMHDNEDLIDSIYERFSTLDRESFNSHILPLISFFASHMSIVPASQGCHDSDSTGLFRHSLQVAALALDFYHTDNIFAKRRSIYDNLFIDERVIFMLSMLHDFTKIVTDMDIYAHDKCYDFFAATLDLFLKKHLKAGSYVKIVFKDKRSDSHDNVQIKAIVSATLLSRLDNLMPILSTSHDLIDLLSFDSQNIYHYAVGICDRSVVRQNHRQNNLSLIKPPLSLKVYLRMSVINLIKTFSYEVNSLHSHIFVTGQGILFAAYSRPFIDLLMMVHEHSSGSDFTNDNVILQTPINVMRKAGVIKLYGSTRVIVYHRVDLYDCSIYVKGIMFVTDTSDLYALDCHVCTAKDSEISALISHFKKVKGTEPDIIKVSKRSSLPYYLDESVLDNIEVQYLSLEQSYLQYEKEMASASKRRYRKKMSAVSSLVTEAKKLSVIDIQRELEQMQLESMSNAADGELVENQDNAVCAATPTDDKDQIKKTTKAKGRSKSKSASGKTVKASDDNTKNDTAQDNTVSDDNKDGSAAKVKKSRSKKTDESTKISESSENTGSTDNSQGAVHSSDNTSDSNAKNESAQDGTVSDDNKDGSAAKVKKSRSKKADENTDSIVKSKAAADTQGTANDKASDLEQDSQSSADGGIADLCADPLTSDKKPKRGTASKGRGSKKSTKSKDASKSPDSDASVVSATLNEDPKDTASTENKESTEALDAAVKDFNALQSALNQIELSEQ